MVVVIWDEGHCLKEIKTQLYTAALKLTKVHCRCILSGTPVQNNLEELWAILNIINKGKMNSQRDFEEQFSKPIKRGQSRDADYSDVLLGDARQEELQQIVRKYMIQRFKEVVLCDELQGKEDIVVFCSLTPLQKRIYQHLLSLPDFDNCRYGKSECPCGSGEPRKTCCIQFILPLNRDDISRGVRTIDERAYIWRKMHFKAPLSISSPDKNNNFISNNTDSLEEKSFSDVNSYLDAESCKSRGKCPTCVSLPCIQMLSKVASHPWLLQIGSEDTDPLKKEDKLNFLKYALTPELIEELGGVKTNTRVVNSLSKTSSGKMIVLEKLLNSFTSAEFKTLLFSYSTKILNIIETFVISKGWRYSRLDGSTMTSRRQELVDKFNKDPQIKIFLISTRAGGLGLNLTSACKVIIFDGKLFFISNFVFKQ